MIDSQFVRNVLTASFATVGIMEVAKNFFRTERTWIYALAMLPLAVVCYFAVEKLPPWIIGGLLTVGCVQICYQTIVQGFKAAIGGLAKKIGGGEADRE